MVCTWAPRNNGKTQGRTIQRLSESLGRSTVPPPLITLWRQTKTRLMRGTDWMTQAVHPIEASSGISLEEIRKETDTADRESERQMHSGDFLILT